MTIATARMIASSLLVYPDERFLERREEFEHIASKLESSYGNPLIEFFSVTSGISLDEIQRHYVEIFDMRRRCSLFLTSWTHGDTRNRGMALIYFKEKYGDAGIAPPPGPPPPTPGGPGAGRRQNRPWPAPQQ